MLPEQVEAFCRWFGLRAKPRTVAEYRRGVLRMTGRMGLGDVRDLTRAAVVDTLAAMPPTKARLNDYLALLAFARWAATDGGLLADPLIEGIPLGKPPSRSRARTMRPFSEAEVRRLIQVAEEDERAKRPRCKAHGGAGVTMRSHLYAVMATVGGRWREMCGPEAVRWADVDWNGQTLTFRSELAKNGHTDVVPLLPSAFDALRRWRALNAAAPAESPIWPRLVRLECLRSDMKAAGIPLLVDGQPAGWHSFRHGLGARLAEVCEPTIAQKVLRHRDIRMTTSVYAQVNTTRVRQAISGLEGSGGTGRYPQSGILHPKIQETPLTAKGRIHDNRGDEPEQDSSPKAGPMGVTGLEPVTPGPDAGNDSLMDVVSTLLTLVSRVMRLARAQEQPHVAQPLKPSDPLPRNDR